MKRSNKKISAFNAGKDPAIKRFVSKNLDITEQIYAIMEKKGITQAKLAKQLEKSESEISKWLSGMHNLTLKSITKLEEALGEDIILSCAKAEQRFKKVHYIQFDTPATPNHIKSKSTTDLKEDAFARKRGTVFTKGIKVA